MPFWFKDWQDEQIKRVRFAEDRISFKFNAFRSTDQQVIFGLRGIAIASIQQPQFLPFLLGGGSARQYRLYALYRAVNGNNYLSHIGQFTGPIRSVRINALVSGQIPQITVVDGNNSTTNALLEYFIDSNDSGGIYLYYLTGSGGGSVEAFLEIYAATYPEADYAGLPYFSSLRTLATTDKQPFPPQFWGS